MDFRYHFCNVTASFQIWALAKPRRPSIQLKCVLLAYTNIRIFENFNSECSLRSMPAQLVWQSGFWGYPPKLFTFVTEIEVVFLHSVAWWSCTYSLHGDRDCKRISHYWCLFSSGCHDNRQVFAAVLCDVDVSSCSSSSNSSSSSSSNTSSNDVTSMSDVQRHQLNVISILPLNVDLVAVTLDFITRAHWTSVAVLTQPRRGMNHHCLVFTYLLSLIHIQWDQGLIIIIRRNRFLQRIRFRL